MQMRQAKQSSVIVLLLVLSFSPAAFSDPFASDEFGFSADFQARPRHPARTEYPDEHGKVLATIDIFETAKPRAWVCAVTIQRYMVPATAEIASELTENRDQFLRQMGSIVASANRTFQGYPALDFTFQNADHSLWGRGLIVIVPAALRRVYLITTTLTPKATPEDAAAVVRFFNSFRLS